MEFTKSTSFKKYPLVKNKPYMSHPLTSAKPNTKVQSELVSLRKKKVKEQEGGKKRSSSHLIKGRYGLGDIGTQQRPRASVGLSLREQGRWKVQQFGGASRTPRPSSTGPALRLLEHPLIS